MNQPGQEDIEEAVKSYLATATLNHDESEIQSCIQMLRCCYQLNPTDEQDISDSSIPVPIKTLILRMASIDPWRKGSILAIQSNDDILSLDSLHPNNYLCDYQLIETIPHLVRLRRLCASKYRYTVIQSNKLPFRMIVPEKNNILELIALDWIEFFAHFDMKKLNLLMWQYFIDICDNESQKKRTFRKSFGWIITFRRLQLFSISTHQVSSPSFDPKYHALIITLIEDHVQTIFHDRYQILCQWLTIDFVKMSMSFRLPQHAMEYYSALYKPKNKSKS